MKLTDSYRQRRSVLALKIFELCSLCFINVEQRCQQREVDKNKRKDHASPNPDTADSAQMPRPLSNFVRELIIFWHLVLNKSVPDCAHLARCDESTVRRVLRRYHESANAHTLPRGHRPEDLNNEDMRYVLSLLSARPTLYLSKIQSALQSGRNVNVSESTICRALHRVGYACTKASKEAAQRDELLRATWRFDVAHIPSKAFVWLDESGVDDHNMHRIRGWTTKGRTPVITELAGQGERVTMLPAMSTEGIVALELFEGGVTKECFLQFLMVHLVRDFALCLPTIYLLSPRF